MAVVIFPCLAILSVWCHVILGSRFSQVRAKNDSHGYSFSFVPCDLGVKLSQGKGHNSSTYHKGNNSPTYLIFFELGAM